MKDYIIFSKEELEKLMNDQTMTLKLRDGKEIAFMSEKKYERLIDGDE